MVWYEYLIYGGAGALGQCVRVCYGIYNAVQKGKEVDPKRMISTLLFGAVSGFLMGLWMKDFRTAFATGIAATDVMEGVVKAWTTSTEKKSKK